MGFLFGGGGGPSEEEKKQRQKTEERTQAQEEKVQRQEIQERRKINQRMRKMKTGGMSQLLGDREEPTQGNPVQVQRTLGPDRNPR
jgi:hypothetical protein